MKSYNNQKHLELIDQALTGDEIAYSKLWDLNIKKLNVYICKKLGNSSDAEEISNEILSKTLLKLSTYNKNYPFSTWLKKIADNACIDYLRKKNLSLNIQTSSINDIDIIDNNNEEKNIIGEERKKYYYLLLNNLNQKQKEVLELRYLQELSYLDISQKMNISVASVKVLIHRAKQNCSMQIKYKKI